MAGIDNKNAILMESYLLKFASNAAVMTIPARDTPGMIASVCMKPIKTIVNILIDFSLFMSSFFSRFSSCLQLEPGMSDVSAVRSFTSQHVFVSNRSKGYAHILTVVTFFVINFLVFWS